MRHSLYLAERLHGQKSMVVLTERQLDKWSFRQTDQHAFIYCRIDRMLHGYHESNPHMSYFDLFMWIDQTIRAQESI